MIKIVITGLLHAAPPLNVFFCRASGSPTRITLPLSDKSLSIGFTSRAVTHPAVEWLHLSITNASMPELQGRVGNPSKDHRGLRLTDLLID